MPGYFAINCGYEILLKRKQVCQFASLLSYLYVHPKSRDSQLGRVPDYSIPSPLAESSAAFAPVYTEWLLKDVLQMLMLICYLVKVTWYYKQQWLHFDIYFG